MPTSTNANENVNANGPLTISKEGLLDSSSLPMPVQDRFGKAVDRTSREIAEVVTGARDEITQAKKSKRFTAEGLREVGADVKHKATEKINKLDADFRRFIMALSGEALDAVSNFDHIPHGVKGDAQRLTLELRSSDIRAELERRGENDAADSVLPLNLHEAIGTDLGANLSVAEARFLKSAAAGDRETVLAVQTSTRLWRQRTIRGEVFKAGIRLYQRATMPDESADADIATTAMQFIGSQAQLATKAIASLKATGRAASSAA